jgi:hypothetical protein
MCKRLQMPLEDNFRRYSAIEIRLSVSLTASFIGERKLFMKRNVQTSIGLLFDAGLHEIMMERLNTSS